MNREIGGRTIAQAFCLLVGLVLIAAGALGFTANATFDQAELALNFEGDPVTGDLFLGLAVNGWHNVVHIASGLLLLLGGLSRAAAPKVLIAFGIVYVAVTVIGFIDERNVLGIIPVNTADNYLHLALAVLGLLVGVLGMATARRRSAGPPRRADLQT
jgi:hypothetical protein